jgi:hypothetical protein
MADVEQSEAVVAESWLVAHQRAHCKGASPLTTFQGLVADELVLPLSAVEGGDPAQIVFATKALTELLVNEAYLIPGEFALEALTSFYVQDYVALASAGGHAHYFGKRGTDPLALQSTRAGLKSMLADPHLALFDLMMRLTHSTAKDARRAAKEAGYKNASAALRDLDKRLAALEVSEPLMPRHRAWLNSLRKLVVVPDADVRVHVERIGARNPLRDGRREEVSRLRAAFERTDPSHAAAHALCEMAGLGFLSLRDVGYVAMREVWPEGPNHRAFRIDVETDRGPLPALFYVEGGLFKRRLAVLIEEGGALPLGSLTLSRRDYQAITPRTF